MDQGIFGYNFNDSALLTRSLTHPSCKGKEHYEKLEFLGDRIISAIIAEYLYLNYPNESEGDLAKRHIAFVNGEILAQIARENNLNERIILGLGERKIDGMNKNSNLENCLEAVIGAIFIDGGGKSAKEVVLKLWHKHFLSQGKPPENPKSELQELLQERGLGLPEYKMVEISGPDHSPVFKMRIIVSNYPEIELSGKSKKVTERELALAMLNKIKRKK